MNYDAQEIVIANANTGQTIGELVLERHNQRKHTVFRFDEAWLDNEDAYPIEPALPLSSAPSFFTSDYDDGLPGSISDTSPDSWGRKVIETALGRGASDLEVLLFANDVARTGAMVYSDEDGNPFDQGN